MVKREGRLTLPEEQRTDPIRRGDDLLPHTPTLIPPHLKKPSCVDSAASLFHRGMSLGVR